MMLDRLRGWFSALDLGGKLLLINLAATITVSSFAAMVLISHLWISERDDLARDAELKARILASNCASAVLFGDRAVASELIGALRLDGSVLAATVFLPSGEGFAVFRKYEGAATRLTEFDLPANTGWSGQAARFHQHFLDVVAPVIADEQTAASLLLRIDMGSIYQRMLAFSAVLLLTAVVATALGSWLLTGLLKRILRPVRRLEAVMHQVSRNDDYSQRAPIGDADEIGNLAAGFNLMIEQIQRRDAALSRELAERKRAEDQLDHQAHHDSVTGLPNRYFFNRHALELRKMRSQRDARLAVIFVDLDNFKLVNDNFGHPVGDALLVGVSQRLKSILRANDIVARLGGDEFAVLLDAPDSLDDVWRLANKMLAALAQPFQAEGRELNVSASMGVAVSGGDACEFDELLSRADAAMYDAKAKGKNNVQLWRPEMSAQTAQRFAIESGLHRAIENGELALNYQPIVDLASGRLAGVEALLRWRNPLLGMVSPAEFIPVAEESRQIIIIGEWVLREASVQLARWLPRFGPLFLAVNVSGRQFREAGFADSVQRIVGESGCPPGLLELEVTESVIMEQTEETLAILMELRRRGFHLSLDDFGTGYSSLSYLKRFPLGKLKIDRSFVSDLPEDSDDVAITQAIVALARNLNMSVVAEGIETIEQAEFLRALDCTYGQGYYFGRPMAAEAFEDFAADNLALESSRMADLA